MDAPRTRTLAQALLLAVLSAALLARCWDAGFLHYDDPAHVSGNERLNEGLIELFKPAPLSTYFPVTLLSYQVDRALFAGWMPHTHLGSWAPGVRAMTLLYHIGAALFLWRMLLRLRLGAGAAFFIALVFAVHPLACETVCWASERKNALAGFFGFAALWAWLAGAGRLWCGHPACPIPPSAGKMPAPQTPSAGKMPAPQTPSAGKMPAPQTLCEPDRWWRQPLTLAFYALALGGKPSALGLLPVILMLELFGGAAGLAGDGPTCWRPCRESYRLALRLLPLALVSAAALVLNIRGSAGALVPPPGGSIFTALLTDLDILTRYLGLLVAPFSLSAAYFVEPVRSLWDPRAACFALVLAAFAASSIVISANRRRAAFGWLWFLGALGPNLNLIALPHLMQDRYIYLSTPGLFLVVTEAAEGLRSRIAGWQGTRGSSVLRVAGAGYVALLVALAFTRGAVWQSMLMVFRDAVNKQPQSVFAHYGLGAAYAQLWEDNRDNLQADKDKLRACRQLWLQEWKTGIDRCPDYRRFVCYQVMALNVGEEFNRQAGEEPEERARQKKLEAAEHYWQVAATRSPESGYDASVCATALGYLASLRISQGQLDEAWQLAGEAVAACDEPPTRLVRARAALGLAGKLLRNGDREGARKFIEQAREDASSVPAEAELFSKAQELLRDPVFEKAQR